MNKMSFNKYLCCSIDLTIATRLISFIGISVSVLLTTVLLNDTSVKNYAISREVSLAFGLDWRHIHPNASAHSHKADPAGEMISTIMIFYSVLFFMQNVLLLFGAIMKLRWFAFPWLICEVLGCTSKVAALIYHLVTEINEISNIFIFGSVIYIVVMIWCWLVVFRAQLKWNLDKSSKHSIFELSELNYDEDKRGVSLLQNYLPFRSQEEDDI